MIEDNWALYRDSGFRSPYPPILGPGLYPRVDAVQIRNDDLSSLLPVASRPTVFGAPLDSHILLFEHANFHGAHKHIVAAEANLNASDDNFFSDKVSSIAVLSGEWLFCRDANFINPYRNGLALNKGAYSFVGDALARRIKSLALGRLAPVILSGVSFQGDGSAWERRLDARGGYFR